MLVSILASTCRLKFLYSYQVPIIQKHVAITRQFARLLKEVRKRRGLSLSALARPAGLARQTVSCIEKKMQSPSLDTLLRITAVLGVKLEKLIAEARRREGLSRGRGSGRSVHERGQSRVSP